MAVKLNNAAISIKRTWIILTSSWA